MSYRFVPAMCGSQKKRSCKSTDGLFDLGAGEKSCVNCAHIMLPTYDENYVITTHLCAVYVEVIHGVPIPCHEARLDESLCGAGAAGWDAAPVPPVKSGPLPYEMTGAAAGVPTSGLETLPDVMTGLTTDVAITDSAASSGPCADCAHFITEGLAKLDQRDGLRCARLIDPKTGDTTPAKDVRADENLCGPNGAWFLIHPDDISNGPHDVYVWDADAEEMTSW